MADLCRPVRRLALSIVALLCLSGAGCEYRPVPDDGPAKGRKLSVVFVDETAELLPGRGEYRRGRDFHDALKAGGHVWRYADQHVLQAGGTEAPADVAGFIRHAQANGGPPRVYVNDRASGRCLWSGKPPADPKVLLETIRSLGG